MATKKKVKQTQKQKQTVSQKVVVNVGTAPRKRRGGGGKKAPSASPLGKGLPSIQGGIVTSSYNPFEVQQLVQNEVKRLHQAEPTLREIIASPKVPLVQDVPTLARTGTGTETMASISAPLKQPLIGGSNVLGQQVSFDNTLPPGHAFLSGQEEQFKQRGFGMTGIIGPAIGSEGEPLVTGEEERFLLQTPERQQRIEEAMRRAEEQLQRQQQIARPPMFLEQTVTTQTTPSGINITVKKTRGRKPKSQSPSK